MLLSELVDFSDYWSVFRFIFVTFCIIFLRYVIISAVFILIFDKWLKSKYNSNKIFTAIRSSNQTKKEIYWSLLTSFIFTIAGTVMLFLFMQGKTAIYTTFSMHDFWYFPISIILVLFLHESYYYFLHRWMHRPSVFRYFHKVHHDSNTTSSWTAFSFHPLESILQALIIPCIVLVIPLHVIALLFILIVMSISATINHLGIEIYPKWMAKSKIGYWIIGATHHAQHHILYTKNFGLYFTFYDRLLKTESEDFVELFNEKVD